MLGSRRKNERINFERGFAAYLMAIDGTWRRSCSIEDISDSGAKLVVQGAIEGLNLKEFFLVLSSTGLAYRRCELIRVNGDELGVSFLKRSSKKTGRRPTETVG